MPRDLEADLAFCESVKPERWHAAQTCHQEKDTEYWVRDDAGNQIAYCGAGDEARRRSLLISQAREAWPEAIHRAMAAEERVKELECALELALCALTDGVEDVPHDPCYGYQGPDEDWSDEAEFEPRSCISELKELRTRLVKCEAGAAAMRNVLQDALPTENPDWWCPHCKCTVPSFDVTYDERHEVCGTYLTAVNTDEWRKRVQAVLSSSAGREAAERLKRLEAVAEATKQLCARTYGVNITTITPKGPDTEQVPAVWHEDLASIREALRALEGGGADDADL